MKINSRKFSGRADGLGPVYGAGQICKWCSLHYKYVNIAQTNWGKKRRAGQIGHTPEPSFIQGPHTPLGFPA